MTFGSSDFLVVRKIVFVISCCAGDPILVCCYSPEGIVWATGVVFKLVYTRMQTDITCCQ